MRYITRGEKKIRLQSKVQKDACARNRIKIENTREDAAQDTLRR